MTFTILVAVEFCLGTRISNQAEKSGLDRSVHGEGLYADKSKSVTPSQRVAELLQVKTYIQCFPDNITIL